MPALKHDEIVSAIVDAFSEAGAAAVSVPGVPPHPKKFYITTSAPTFPLWIYAWTLTHGGGRARPEHEYRIQLTSVQPPLPLNPEGPTLLLGYEPNTRCFAGFDIKKHRRFSTNSPSIQINIDALRNAQRDGFCFVTKGNDEIAVGFRSDNLLAYTLAYSELHRSGTVPAILEVISRISSFLDVSREEIGSFSQGRQRTIATVSRLVRDSAFRNKITVAYDRKCAVTGMQLRLVDAAHILPVGAPESSDDVSNGLCLSPTYHRAYDNGLIYLAEDMRMRINPGKREELVSLRLDGGLCAFESTLGNRIFLPPDRKQWPCAKFIRAANQFRGIAVSH
jgi:putative restriction endonuclease